MAKLLPPAGDDRLNFRGQMTVPTTPTIDPLTKGVRIVVTNAGGGTPPVDVTIPGGAAWTGGAARAVWIYRDKLGSAGGVTRVVIKGKPGTGDLRFSVRGRLGSYAMPTGPNLTATLVVDSPVAATGQCGEIAYGADGLSSCKLVGDHVYCR